MNEITQACELKGALKASITSPSYFYHTSSLSKHAQATPTFEHPVTANDLETFEFDEFT